VSRFLVDESVTRKIREWLKNKGFETINVSDLYLKGARDQVVADYAAKNRLVIITLDTDYAQIYHNLPKGTLGVIVVRANPSTPSNILDILVKAHEKVNLKKTGNQLIIITKRKIRIID
jgi:predicted nuclease of predicted toxin-antitoxin system